MQEIAFSCTVSVLPLETVVLQSMHQLYTVLYTLTYSTVDKLRLWLWFTQTQTEYLPLLYRQYYEALNHTCIKKQNNESCSGFLHSFCN